MNRSVLSCNPFSSTKVSTCLSSVGRGISRRGFWILLSKIRNMFWGGGEGHYLAWTLLVRSIRLVATTSISSLLLSFIWGRNMKRGDGNKNPQLFHRAFMENFVSFHFPMRQGFLLLGGSGFFFAGHIRVRVTPLCGDRSVGSTKSRATFFIRGGLNVRLTILSPDPWRNMTGGPIQEREKNTGID